MKRSDEHLPWHRHFETVGSIVAIVVGVAALFVSFDQSRVMREEIRASIWPALQVDGFVTRDESRMLIGVRVQNAGVGPALVERVSVLRNGEVVPDIHALREQLAPDGDLSQQVLRGRVIAAGDTVEPFSLAFQAAGEADAVDIMQSLASEWSFRVCYCSTLGQCWVTADDNASPDAVASCSDQPSGDF
jgi:hypothetical protein